MYKIVYENTYSGMRARALSALSLLCLSLTQARLRLAHELISRLPHELCLSLARLRLPHEVNGRSYQDKLTNHRSTHQLFFSSTIFSYERHFLNYYFSNFAPPWTNDLS
jgi:hypothetical protein